MQRNQRAFTIIELLVVVSIIALLVGILLPAISKARDQARLTISQANLRNLGTAHFNYAAEWSDRHFTLVVDSLASYGGNVQAAMNNYHNQNGGELHAPVYLGWGYSPDGSQYGLWRYPMSWAGNRGLVQPIVFQQANGIEYFGSFRFVNCKQFSQYVNGRFYDKVYYAPKDVPAYTSAEPCFEDPGEFCQNALVQTDLGDIPAWSSYCFSPSAMYNPAVMRRNDPSDDSANGWQNPFSIGGGLRAPSLGQARYADLKTQIIEHHWLQNTQAECNPGFQPGTYDGCEPYYFNHSFESVPMALFMDGHIEGMGMRECERANGRVEAQTGNSGTWLRSTPFGLNGYLSEYGFDTYTGSPHILTTDGILGRDVISQ